MTKHRKLTAQELDDFAWAIHHYAADAALDGHPKRATDRVQRLRALESLLANALVDTGAASGVPRKCDCWKHDRQVCDVCQGVTGDETDASGEVGR